MRWLLSSLHSAFLCRSRCANCISLSMGFAGQETRSISFLYHIAPTAARRYSWRIIAYHHHMEAEYEIAGSDIYEAYIADEQRYRQVTPP
jgi:hypothetical protein